MEKLAQEWAKHRHPEIKEQLAVVALPLVTGLTRRWAHKYMWSQQVLDPDGEAGTILMEAIDKYPKVAKKIKFKSLIYKLVMHRMVDALRIATHYDRRNKKMRIPPPVSLEVLLEQEATFQPEDTQIDNKWAKFEVEEIRDELDLDYREKQCIVLMLKHGGDRHKVWVEMGVSESRICQLLKSIRRRYEMARKIKYTEAENKWLRAWMEEHKDLGKQKEVVPLLEEEFNKVFDTKRNGLALWAQWNRLIKINYEKTNGKVQYMLLLHNGDEKAGGRVIICPTKEVLDRKISEATIGATTPPPHVIFTRARSKVTVEILPDD